MVSVTKLGSSTNPCFAHSSVVSKLSRMGPMRTSPLARKASINAAAPCSANCGVPKPVSRARCCSHCENKLRGFAICPTVGMATPSSDARFGLSVISVGTFFGAVLSVSVSSFHAETSCSMTDAMAEIMASRCPGASTSVSCSEVSSGASPSGATAPASPDSARFPWSCHTMLTISSSGTCSAFNTSS